MLIVNQRHLEAVLSEYCLHYNQERPHRSRSLRPPASRGDPITLVGGRLERSTRLGGLLSEYRRMRLAPDVILESHTQLRAPTFGCLRLRERCLRSSTH